MVKLEWKDKQGIDPVTLCFAFAAMNAHLVQLDGEQYYGIKLADLKAPKTLVDKIVENGWALLDKDFLLLGKGGVFSPELYIEQIVSEEKPAESEPVEGVLKNYEVVIKSALEDFRSYVKKARISSAVPETFKRLFNRVHRNMATPDELVKMFNVTVALNEQSQLFSQASSPVERTIVSKVLSSAGGNGDVYLAMIFEYIFNYATYKSGAYNSPTLNGLGFHKNKILTTLSKPTTAHESDKF